MRILALLAAFFIVVGLTTWAIVAMPSKKARVTKSRTSTSNQPSRADNVLTANTIKAMQIALNRNGSTLDVSGKLDKDTQNALRQFQRKNKLQSTGRPDRTTLVKLGVVAS